MKVPYVGLWVVAVMCSLVHFAGPRCAEQDKGEDKDKTWTVKLAEGARDVHTIEPKKDELVQVILTGTTKSDVDLYVFDPDGKEVAKDDSIGPDGFVAFKATKPGKYKVEVRNLGPGANTSTVLVDTVPAPPATWTVEMPAKKKYTRAVLLKQGQQVVATLTGKNAKSDVDLFVLFGNKSVGEDTSVGPNGKVEFTAKEAGVYRIVIHNISRQADVSTVEVRSVVSEPKKKGS
jgi:Bacterial pre-peptidase C-terminal domain